MFVFWGVPADGTEKCVPSATSSFDDCINACISSASCMLVYGNDNTCQLCDLYTVTQITQTGSDNGTKTAVKVDEPNDGCPNSMLTNQYTRTDIVGGYTLSYSGGQWTISGPRCEVGWRMFDRQTNGFFCLSVIPADQPIDRYAANDACNASYEAALAGMNSLEEKQFIMDSGIKLIGSKPEYEYTKIWLSGGRIPSCTAASGSECAGLKGFQLFTYQSNFDAYTFAPGYPTYNKDGDLSQNCLSLMMQQSESAWDGLVTNSVCTTGCNSAGTICALGYLCGAPAVTN